MNKRLLNLALAWALLLASASPEAREPGAADLFREIRVNTGEVIALGEPFDPAGLAESVGEHVYSLLPGRFAGAEKLLVTVTAEGRVLEMQFIYRTDLSFDNVVGRYEPRFGPPHALDDAGQEPGVYWQDRHTRLEVRRPSASVPAVSTRLLQR